MNLSLDKRDCGPTKEQEKASTYMAFSTKMTPSKTLLGKDIYSIPNISNTSIDQRERERKKEEANKVKLTLMSIWCSKLVVMSHR